MKKIPLSKRILAKMGLELHVIRDDGRVWMSLPLSDCFKKTYKDKDVAKMSFGAVHSLHVLHELLSHAVGLPGHVAQVGVYKGGSVALLASIVEGTGKEYHCFDTFEGLPPTKEQDNVNGYKDPANKEMADTSIGEVYRYLKEYSCVRLHKGLFPDSAHAVEHDTFCFAYLDGDLYQTTKDGLEFFFSRLWTGGVIVVDDYGSRRWAGVKTAVEEFMRDNDNASLIQLAGCQAVIIKR